MKINRIEIPYFIEYSKFLDKVTKMNLLIDGHHLELFKKKFLNLFDKKDVCFTSNGFSALFLSLKALKLKNENILMPCASTCYSILNAILSSGNIPIFCDINIKTLSLDIKDAIKKKKQYNIKYVISPNHFGILSEIKDLKKNGFFVIEDASQSFLSSKKYNLNGDITIFSFYPTKIINCIDGGAIFGDENVIENSKNLVYYKQQTENDNIKRYNFRFPNLHAAYGLVTLKNIPKIEKKLTKINSIYLNELKPLNFKIVCPEENYFPTKFLLYIEDNKFLQYTKQKLQSNKIGSINELLLLDKNYDNKMNKLTNSIISLPFHYNLTLVEMKYIINIMNNL